MAGTKLCCPHCGSTLTFGQTIAAGASVPCLICDRTLVAGGESAEADAGLPETVENASPTVADVRPAVVVAAASPVQAGLPRAAVPVATGVSPPPGWPSAPAAQRAVAAPAPAPTPGSNVLPLVIGGVLAAGFLVFMVAGLAFLLWRGLAGSLSTPPSNPQALAQGGDGNSGGNHPTPGTGSKPAGNSDGGIDVADEKQPDKLAPAGDFNEPGLKSGSGKGPAPFVPVLIAANVPGVDQQRIDAAIDKGVRYLKKTQNADGTWPGPRPIGYTALAGLTLLECKVPTNDPHVQTAANYIRKNVGKLNATYELSLAILFLDRIGSPKDKTIIQGLALRLTAGQNEAGGWTYTCPTLTPPDMHQLLTFLKSHRPEEAAPLRGINPAGGDTAKQVTTPSEKMPKQVAGGADDPFRQLAELLELPKGLRNPSDEPPSRDGGTINKPADLPKDKPASEKPATGDPAKGGMPEKDRGKKIAPIAPGMLPPPLQALPVVALNANKGKLKIKGGSGDNSNTQFALLGLWAARRQDVPTEYSLMLAKQRFDFSQNKDGGWAYQVGPPNSTNSMTCVGLIGLAMGHGALAGDGKAKPQDPAIQDGLRALGRHIGTPSNDPNAKPPMQNLYFLWSVERVAMLYDLKTIGGKDWYGWGAQTLLPNQFADGHWQGGFYHGHSPHLDTCFALLFLKRSNLVPDLTENLRLRMVIHDPEAK